MPHVDQFFTLDVALFKKKAIAWADKHFTICLCFDSCGTHTKKIDFLLTIENKKNSTHALDESNYSLASLKSHIASSNKWIVGHISYDIKNDIYKNLYSSNKNIIGFPRLYFFSPDILISISNNVISITCETNNFIPENIFNEIDNFIIVEKTCFITPFQPYIYQDTYVENVKKILHEIKKGYIYELTYCQAFVSSPIGRIDPLALYNQLIKQSPSPFACYYKLYHHYLLCASPERFLTKEDNKIYSQPMKGTIKRGSNLIEDQTLSSLLYNNVKERAENIMIVDLVRNDLSKICNEGTVHAPEIAQVYSFSHTHQLVSTIQGEIMPDKDFVDCLYACFPMGSMTGAPKYKSMQLIETFESTQRNLYSGSVFYIDPERNFDANVIIRSMFYNRSNNILSYSVGGAITNKSNPIEEYNECLLKSAAINEIVKHNI